MSIYEKNLEAIKQYRPYLIPIMEQKDDLNATVIDTGGMPNLMAKGALLYRPTAEDYYNKIEMPTGKKNLFVIGCGLGLWYEKMKNTGGTKPVSMIIIEKNTSVFKAWLTAFDVSDLIKNPAVSIIVGLKLEEAYEPIQEAIAKNPIGILKHILMSGFIKDGYTALDVETKKYYAAMLEFCIQGSEQSMADFGNDIEDSFFGFENLLMSAKRMAGLSGIKEWKGIAKDIPGIVVGAGPSLDKNKALLAKWKGKAVIGACDTALPLLLKDGIVPDFVTSIERTPTTIKYYEGLENDPNIKKVIFAPAAVIKPEIYELCSDKYGMPTIAVFRDFKHFEWIPFERGIIRSGKSATHLIFKMLADMGCNPIILVGQDCAFAEDDATHAVGADHSSQGMKSSGKYKQQMQVMGNSGKMLKTLRVWYDFKRTFEKYAIKHKDILIVNATEGGAVIEGTKVVRLDDAFTAYGDKVAPILPVRVPTPEETQVDTDKLMKQKDGTLQYLYLFANDCDKLLAIDDHTILGNALNNMLNHQSFSLVLMHLVQSYLFWWSNTMAYLMANKAQPEELVKVSHEFILAMKLVASEAKYRIEVLL